ncbi:MAG: serine/threonine protein kinase, partial [Proteobacteria bacterium]|nr:serine/threonine protein kinase [Pseudomonadota bacterium]
FAVVNSQFPNKANDVFPEHIPDSLVRVIRKCLLEVDQRYASAVEIVNDLAIIDGELLDWQYSVANGTRRWSKQIDDTVTWIEIDPAGASIAKKGKVGGAERRVTDYCQPTLNRQSTKRFLREN